MGQAKRRQQNDLEFGIKKKKNMPLIYLGELAKSFYEKYGRGLFIYVQGCSLFYAKSSYNLLSSSDRAFIKNYDPEKEYVLLTPFVDSIWQTSNEKIGAAGLRIGYFGSIEQVVEHTEVLE